MFSKYSLTIAKFNHLFRQDLPFDKMLEFESFGESRARECRAGGPESKVQVLRLALQAEEAAQQKS